jgi:prepilin peptidase CpaA
MNVLVVTITLVLLLLATVCDLRKREVPDWIAVAILLWGTVATIFRLHEVGWLDLMLGTAIGFGLGAVVFYFGGLGGGDVKLLAAIGAVSGPIGLLFVLFWMALAGGLLAFVAVARGRREFAYVPAITLGFAAALIYPGGLWEYLNNR